MWARRAFWGFLFGTIGLAGLANIPSIPFSDVLASILMFPGMLAAGSFWASNDSVALALGVFFSGVLYALLFMGLGFLFGRPRPA